MAVQKIKGYYSGTPNGTAAEVPIFPFDGGAAITVSSTNVVRILQGSMVQALNTSVCTAFMSDDATEDTGEQIAQGIGGVMPLPPAQGTAGQSLYAVATGASNGLTVNFVGELLDMASS